MKYNFSDDDIKKALSFVKNYHLEPTKRSSGRTNQGKRGFGGELDEFFPGKLVEIGVCSVLENYAKNKSMLPDFEIYSDKEVGEKSDPDITEVIDANNISRPPNTFVEIKRCEINDKWLGPRQHQLKDLTNGFMIHASLKFEDDKSKKQNDIIGSVLKKISNPDFMKFDDFSDLESLELSIDYAYSFKDIREKGHFFPSGNIIPDTEFPNRRKAYKQDGSMSATYEKEEEFSSDTFHTMYWESSKDELSFSEWEVKGKHEILKDKYGKKFIHALDKVTMFNEVFGLYELLSDHTYQFYFKNTLGKQGDKDIFKAIDDYWFSKRRLEELLKNNDILSTDSTLKLIAETI